MNPIDRAAGLPGYREDTPSSCEVRGFHGPFVLDRNGSDKESATCMLCGKHVSTAEHLAAYQIAVFHGLAG